MSQTHESGAARGSQYPGAANLAALVRHADAHGGEALMLLSETFLASAVEAARCRFDPEKQSDEFAQALWDQLDAGFGLTRETSVEGDLPSVWFDDADDPDIVVWGRDGA